MFDALHRVAPLARHDITIRLCGRYIWRQVERTSTIYVDEDRVICSEVSLLVATSSGTLTTGTRLMRTKDDTYYAVQLQEPDVQILYRLLLR